MEGDSEGDGTDALPLWMQDAHSSMIVQSLLQATPTEASDYSVAVGSAKNPQYEADRRHVALALGRTSLAWDTVDPPQIFWINADTETGRRTRMEAMLGHALAYSQASVRVRAYTINDLSIDRMALMGECLGCSQTAIMNGRCSRAKKFDLRNSVSKGSDVASVWSIKNGILESEATKAIITKLCVRPKNSAEELMVTLSNFLAIYKAVYSGIWHTKHQPHPSQQQQQLNSESPESLLTFSASKGKAYAVVLQDYIDMPFHIDFDALVYTAPSGALTLLLTFLTLLTLLTLLTQMNVNSLDSNSNSNSNSNANLPHPYHTPPPPIPLINTCRLGNPPVDCRP